MPHVQIDGPCSLDSFWERFRPETDRREETILKTTSAFRCRDASSILVDCTVVEGFLRQSFLVELHQRRDGILLRIFHSSHPERTAGIRECIAWIAAGLLRDNPESRVGKSTLGMEIPAR